ncbi:imidazole glycerol phosphate synthase subunit HisH [Methanococcus aeolicus]|uniref:Imidazole glycerol phosphate synthase subunit HisH n=1 Tax=Methanococcus aeolicus (strain ATCC BAA-1280 / DSM 17508 / OCM 812 / Nankai-3) TaxID=419665 RepID=A6UTF5_META3|nr:imidazole glycerol phosphate synthase subunit HisH [Methanococcus aeolicus]ABR55777.1 imidazole glycerol phosphate synthase, glutamine amidotransferase subunit [Methanococcus aeolicus Nankai-3]UXM84117.1 imidazole glycerol phosphate synthase subunit HisH [Methanococcus aeolicus]
MIAIIDYNAGNLRSIKKAVELYSNNIVITNDPETIFSADKIILPGVGNFGSVMQNLSIKNGEYSLKEVIGKAVENVPFLGICLGMQLLMEQSEECGDSKDGGLGIIKGDVLKFKGVEKIPHMGWNNVEQVKDIPLFEGIKNNEYFYFVHSYFVNPSNADVIAGVSDYGNKFACVLNKDNIYATQFHPEKSGNAGLKMIENFVELI